MSQENAESAPHLAPGATYDPGLRGFFERGFSAWNDGDLDVFMSLSHPEIEFSPELDEAGHPIFPGLRPTYRGHEGLRRFWEDWNSGFERAPTLQPIGAVYGSGCVAVMNHFRAVGRGGVSAERDIAGAYEVRDGLLYRARNYARWEDALEALGMPTDLTPGPL